MKFHKNVNYFMLTVAFTVLWGSIDFLYIAIQIFSLRNSSIVDTSTAFQSLGSFFSSKPFLNTDPGGSYFSVHASEFLYLLLQAVSLKFSSLSLYAVQTVLTFGAAIPLFLIARNHLRDERSAFFIAIAYLFFPYTQTNVFELLTLFLGLIIFSFYFLETRHFIAFIITFLLSLSTMEFAPLLGVSVGLYLLLVYFLRVKKSSSGSGNLFRLLVDKIWVFLTHIRSNHGAQLGMLIGVVSIVFYIIDSHIILFFSSGTHAITSNLASTGGNLLPTLSSKVESFFQLNSPFAFISFFDPIWLLELPWAIASGITSFGPYWEPGVYYDTYLIPFIVMSAIFGISRLSSFFNDTQSRKKFTRYITALILVISVVSMVSISIVPMAQNIQTSTTYKGNDVAQLAALIPQNAGVFTGSNEMPIVSAHSWNTWIFGSPRPYTLFNASNGPPYNLSGSGFLGASGSYLLYSSNYTGLPKFNNLEVMDSLAGASLEPISDSTSIFLPPGNYQLNASFDYSSASIVKAEIGKGNMSRAFMLERYVVMQPFTVTTPVNLSEISVPATMYPGYYILQSEITVGNNPGKVVAQDSIGRNEYNTPSLQFSFSGQELLPNVTYYFWLWSSGDPGGLYIPLTSGNSSSHASMATIYSGSGTDSYGYYFDSYTNLTNLNKSLEFTIISSSVENKGIVYPSHVMLSIGGMQRNITLTNSNYFTSTVEQNTSSEFVLAASSSFLNGTIKGIAITITSETVLGEGHNQGIPILFWLIAIFSLFAFLIVISFTDIFIPESRRISNISRWLMGLSFLLFYSVLAYFYYSGSFNFTILRVLVSLELISLFSFLIFGNHLRTSDQDKRFPISVFDEP